MSIWERVYAVRGVPHENIVNMLTSLESAGFNVHAKREGAVLRHVNVDSLPCLNDSERATLRDVATGTFLEFS